MTKFQLNIFFEGDFVLVSGLCSSHATANTSHQERLAISGQRLLFFDVDGDVGKDEGRTGGLFG